MIVRNKTLLLGLAAVALLCSIVPHQPALSQESAQTPTPLEQAAIFEWFDGLGFKDFAKLSLVQVTTGWWSQAADDEPKNSTMFAFLIEESQDSFRVYGLDLSESDFKFSPADAPAHLVVKFEKVSLAETVKRLLRERANRDVEEDFRSWRRFGKQLNEGSEFIVLARACIAQNEPDLARQLVTVASELLTKTNNGSAIGFRQAFVEDLGRMTMWRIILDFGDANVPRTELLAKLQTFPKSFPNTEYCELATKTAQILEPMVREDRDHQAPVDFQSLGTREKVAELIFQLRDQNGEQWSQPGSCDIFSGDWFLDIGDKLGDVDAKSRLGSPARQLVDIGFDAVPQLIEALDDRRLTRSVGFHRNFYFSHHVLRVGDCVEQILERIANRRFYEPASTNAAMIKEGKQMAVKARVGEWWREVQQKGEKQVLLEATIAGDENSVRAARQLIAKYPTEALDAIAKGAAKAQSPWDRNQLIMLASSFGEAAHSFLKEQMTRAPTLDSRVTAADELVKRDPTEVTAAMINEWKALSQRVRENSSQQAARDAGEGELIRFLASQNSRAAVKALADAYSEQPIATRFAMVTAFGQYDRSLGSVGKTADSLKIPSQRAPTEPAVDDAIESLLITALSDTARHKGLSGNWDDYRFTDPRICDMACKALACRFAGKYAFKPLAGIGEMETQRVRALNVYRQQQGMELLAEPEPRLIKPLANEKLAPKLAAVLAARDERTRTAAIAEVKNLGVGALPAVVQAIASTSQDQPIATDLRELARELSLTIHLVTFAKDSAPLPESLKAQLDSLNGKSFSQDPLIDLLQSVASDLPKGLSGIELIATRSSEISAVELTVDFNTRWSPKNGTQQMWNTSWTAVINGKPYLTSSGSMSLETAMKRQAYEDFAEIVKTALNSAYNKPFEIRYSLIRNQ